MRVQISSWCRARAPLAALLLLAPSAARAAADDQGLRLGAWRFAPYLESSIAFDSNVFRATDDAESNVSDEITTFAAGLLARLPLRQHRLALGFEASQVGYQQHQFSRDTDTVALADVTLQLGKLDQLRLVQTASRGFTDVGRLENSELVFDGQAYDGFWSLTELSRTIPHRAGYSLQFAWRDVDFETSTSGVEYFYDQRGYDAGAEYRQPLAGYKWLVAFYGIREIEHFETGTQQITPFRTELAQNAQLGLRGSMGKDQPFLVRVGWGKFRYDYADPIDPTDPTVEPSDFTGITLHGRLRFRVGGGSTLDVALDHRPQASSYDTHYVNTVVRAELARTWLRNSRFGVSTRYDANNYGDPIEVAGCGPANPAPPPSSLPFVREDDRYEVQAYVDWLLHRRFGYRMSVAYDARSSNCAAFEYNATVVQAGVRLGWF